MAPEFTPEEPQQEGDERAAGKKQLHGQVQGWEGGDISHLELHPKQLIGADGRFTAARVQLKDA